MDGGLQRTAEDRAGEPGYTAYVSDDREPMVEIRTLAKTLWRRKWVIAASILICVGLTTLMVLQITPRYQATALVMIETREQNFIDLDSVVAGIGANSSALQSEIEIIRSTQLLERVIGKLRLDEDPEFNPSLNPPSMWATLRNPVALAQSVLPTGLLSAVGLNPEPQLVDELAQEERTRRLIVEDVARRLRVELLRSSFIISISFESTDRRKAALIANTIADQYIVDQLEAKFEATQRATVWLNERVTDLKDRVEDAERGVEEFKASLAIVDGQGLELTNQQLAQLNTNLIDARAERAEAEARFNQVARLVDRGGDVTSAAEVLSSPLIQRLREQQAEVERQLAELSTRYGERHPQMIDGRAKVADIRRAIEVEVRKIVEGLRNELQVARAREQSLQDNVSDLEQKALGQSKASVRLRQLEREADANRLIYENFLSRFKETSEQSDLQQADARIISRADPPTHASSPRKSLALAIAGVFGAFTGLGLVFLLESLNNTFRSARQFEAETGLTVLSSIPKIGSRRIRREIFEYALQKPNSALSESVRNLRTSLFLANVDKPPQVVLITSALPAEGKSTLAALLALTTARMGKRTIIIDCDLRRPSLAAIINGESADSLISVVAGRTPLEEAVIVHPDEPELHALTSTVSQANAADILASKRFANLIETIREEFDFVVLDTPPTLAVSDARIIAKLVDTSLFVTKWDSTPREVVRNGIRKFSEVDAPLAGAAMSIVDMKKQATYDYAGDGYYLTRYSEYYHN